jgi:hypothetical protein
MQIKREVTGDLAYRFITASDSSSAPIPLPAATGADSVVPVAVPAEWNGKGVLLEVIDNGKGKVAHLPVSTSGVTPLTANDFTLVQTVLVPVQVRGKGGLTNATVTLTDSTKKYTRSWLLKPSDNGVAQFSNAPLGVPVTVTVSAGGDTPVSQTQTLPTDPAADGYRWPAITVDWQDAKALPAPAAPIVAPAAATATAPASTPATPQSGGDALSGLVSMVVSLLFLGGIAYGLLWAYRQGHLKKLLDGLGIQTQPLVAAGPQGSPFARTERAPIQPITEGTADPLAGAAGFAAVTPGVTPVASTGPRLVATGGTYSGNIFPISEGAVDIGRDPMSPVALPQDTNASRRHATIQAMNGQYTVTDNGSSNGTYLNGVRINSQAPQPLRPGDELQVGMTRFRFEA